MRKKLSKIILSILLPVVIVLTAGILSFTSITSTAHALSGNGGGFYVGKNSTFNFTRGSISGMTATNGGGVYVANGGTFNMSGGAIYGNTATANGNNIYNEGTFTMTGGNVGDRIEFGSYPKTIKASNVTIDENDVDDKGYFLGSDGERYAKIKADPFGSNYTFSDGTTIVKRTEYYFKVEPIKWRILSKSNGEAILFAEDILTAGISFSRAGTRTINGNTVYANNYEYSTIRAWLNGYNGSDYNVEDYSSFTAGDYQNNGFYNQAFSQSEKNMILTTEVDNSKETTISANSNYTGRDYPNPVCNNTNDKIWLLSYQDANNSNYGFDKNNSSHDIARQKIITDYAKANYYMCNNGSWWLRSPVPSDKGEYRHASTVNCTTGVNFGSAQTAITADGIVPALKIKTNSIDAETTTGYNIYNTGSMNLYGGKVYDNIYSSVGFNTKMAANIAGEITLADSATISVQDYAGTTPEYNIELLASRGVGTIMTFVGSSTEPDLKMLNISGYDKSLYEVILTKNSSGNWEAVLATAMWLPNGWKTEIASSTYMTTTMTPANITSIKFVSSIPSGYSQIGTLSTGLKVYASGNDIAFVNEKKIYSPINSVGLFEKLSALTSIDFANFNTSRVTNFGDYFSECTNLSNLDLSGFDTSSATLMHRMFNNCHGMTELNLSSFNTSNVTSFASMFQANWVKKINLSSFDTSNVTDFGYLFYGASRLTSIDVSNFNTSKATSMSGMFYNCAALTTLDLSNFDTSNVTTMHWMFAESYRLTELNLSSFNTSNVTDMQLMFYNDFGLPHLDVSMFDTSKVTDMLDMFRNCSKLKELDLSNFDMSNVGNRRAMLEFGDTENLELLKTPYNNRSALPITTGSLLFDEFGNYITEVPARLSASVTYTNNAPANFFLKSWKTEIASSDYMTTTVTPSNITSIKFASSVPTGYSQIGTLSTGLPVYASGNDIAFVLGQQISMAKSIAEMFSELTSCVSISFDNIEASRVTNYVRCFQNDTSLQTIDFTNFNSYDANNMAYMFNNCNALTSINFTGLGTSLVTSMDSMFRYCTSLISLDLRRFNTSAVQSFNSMFAYCSNLETIDIGEGIDFSTSNVKDMSYMFVECHKLKSFNFSHFDTSNVTFLTQMFYECQALTELDLSSFNTSKVTTMSSMFYRCRSLKSLDLSNFDTSNVTTMYGMFYDCYSLTELDLSSFNTLKVTNMSYMFTMCHGLKTLDLSSFNMSNVTSVTEMLKFSTGATGRIELLKTPYNNTMELPITTNSTLHNQSTGIIVTSVPANTTSSQTYVLGAVLPSGWKTEIASSTYMTTTVTPANITSIKFVADVPSGYSQIGALSTGLPVYASGNDIAFVCELIYAPEDSDSLFSSLSNLTTIEFDTFNTSRVTNMTEMFYSCSGLTDLDLSSFDTSKVMSMNGLFAACKNLKSLDLRNFDTSKVTRMISMFNGCQGLTNLNVSNFNTSNVTNMREMFSDCMSLASLNVSGFSTLNVINMFRMFCNCKSLTSLNVSGFNTTKVTNMGSMFSNCSSLTSLNVSNFNTTKVTEMSYMFYNCSSLTSLGVNSFNTTKVTEMNYMFSSCSSLTSLDVSSFNTTNVTDMGFMFSYCKNLTSLDLSNFNKSQVTDMNHMFYNCLSLTSLNLSNFNTSKVTNMSYMFCNCSSLVTLDISSFNMSKVTNMSSMLNFGTSNNIQTLYTPYNNKYSLPITTGSTLYNVATGSVVTSVPANTVGSLTYMASKTFSANWKEEIVSSEYMATPYSNVSNITSIKFTKTVPSGYTQIGTLSTGLPVYALGNDVAFVWAAPIFAPENGCQLFFNLLSVKTIDFGNFNTSKVTNMNDMFRYIKMDTLDLSGFDTSNVTTMNGMFEYSSFKELNLSSFNTSKVTDMSYMFEACGSLTYLNLSGFDTSNVTKMTGMFNYCAKLETLDLSCFNMTKVTDASNMFGWGTSAKIRNIKTPYNNSMALAIPCAVTLYDVSTGETVTGVLAGTTSSKTFAARYTITFDSDVTETAYAYHGIAGIVGAEPIPPSRDGYEFNGWYFNGVALSLAYFTANSQVTGSWTAVDQRSYTVGSSIADEIDRMFENVGVNKTYQDVTHLIFYSDYSIAPYWGDEYNNFSYFQQSTSSSFGTMYYAVSGSDTIVAFVTEGKHILSPTLSYSDLWNGSLGGTNSWNLSSLDLSGLYVYGQDDGAFAIPNVGLFFSPVSFTGEEVVSSFDNGNTSLVDPRGNAINAESSYRIFPYSVVYYDENGYSSIDGAFSGCIAVSINLADNDKLSTFYFDNGVNWAEEEGSSQVYAGYVPIGRPLLKFMPWSCDELYWGWKLEGTEDDQTKTFADETIGQNYGFLVPIFTDESLYYHKTFVSNSSKDTYGDLEIARTYTSVCDLSKINQPSSETCILPDKKGITIETEKEDKKIA